MRQVKSAMKLKSKIIPRIFGGIGNQLFCYAAARRLAIKNNADLVIDNVSGFKYDKTYKRHYQLNHFNIPCPIASYIERLEPFPRVRRFLMRSISRRRPFEERTYIKQEGNDFDHRLLHVRPCGTVYLDGYWQSEDYFKDIQETIRSDLKIIPPVDEANRVMAANIRDCLSVAVHVRFFDAPRVHGGTALGLYYARAVALMEAQAPGAKYFLFSDQVDAARAFLPLPSDRIICVKHNHGDKNAYADLWLMSQSRHFIIANSTFSWWGAWLGGSMTKTVITPQVHLAGLSAWGFKGLIPGGWIQINTE